MTKKKNYCDLDEEMFGYFSSQFEGDKSNRVCRLWTK